jgi:L-serine dehydratase
MPFSSFDIFRPGVGPSSSHTMGPMLAALTFVQELADAGTLRSVTSVTVELMGSLAATGRGHRTDVAVQAGLAGFHPGTVDGDSINSLIDAISSAREIRLLGRHSVPFDAARQIIWSKERRHPRHPNALTLTAMQGNQNVLETRTYLSVGGGAIIDERAEPGSTVSGEWTSVPYPFQSGAELLEMAGRASLSIAGLMRANERQRMGDTEIDARLDSLWARMEQCIERGMRQDGTLPGGLEVPRRARKVHNLLRERSLGLVADPLAAMDFVNLWALAVNEENAAGGAVVTAPTNGAAGIVPAVISYYRKMLRGTEDGIRTFLLTAAAIGALYKQNASISGAEVGCQGEVGVACSMAAAGLTAVLGGTNAQIENAAEIGMEHNLGLTCDPIGGLVQVPCIERNAMGAIKAIDASRLALLGDGTHYVSLDKVIATMLATGRDMSNRYKETSEGGLAVNYVAC